MPRSANPDPKLAAVLKRLREDRGLSQEHVAWHAARRVHADHTTVVADGLTQQRQVTAGAATDLQDRLPGLELESPHRLPAEPVRQ